MNSRGRVYHLTARGTERRRTFRDDEDRLLFLQTIEECVLGHGLRVHGFCLMPNHYHLLVETPRGNLSRALGWLQTAYTIRADARILAAQQPERRWRAWVLARLGGERNIDIAHELGYRDGSAITHLLNRLENQASKDPVFARRQASLRTQFESSPSGVKS